MWGGSRASWLMAGSESAETVYPSRLQCSYAICFSFESRVNRTILYVSSGNFVHIYLVQDHTMLWHRAALHQWHHTCVHDLILYWLALRNMIGKQIASGLYSWLEQTSSCASCKIPTAQDNSHVRWRFCKHTVNVVQQWSSFIRYA